MSEISFYQLKRHSMERALLRLLEKALSAGERAVVRLAEEAEVPLMDTALWSVDPDSFLAHGTSKSARPEQQPVFLTAGQDNPAGAAFLFILPGAPAAGLDKFKRVFFVFDGNSENQVAKAREQWKTLKNEDHDLTYWSQTDNGGWQKK